MSGPDPLVIALLKQILERETEILAQLRAVQRASEDPGIAALLHAVIAACGALPFTAADLLEHAALSDRVALAEALATCGANSPRKLGKLLRRIEGAEFDGLVVQRVAEGRDGIVWRIASLRV